MTEAEWDVSTDPQAMLSWLNPDGEVSGRSYVGVSSRKLRLFCCACCRQVWHLLTDDVPCSCHTPTVQVVREAGAFWSCSHCGGSGRINRSHRAVEVAERYADGVATEEERRQADHESYRVPGGSNSRPRELMAVQLALWPDKTPYQGPSYSVPQLLQDWPERATEQAHLLREIFGNPWRPVTVALDGCLVCGGEGWHGSLENKWDRVQCFSCGGKGKWSRFLTPAVLRIAEDAYHLRDWSRLTILSDELEAAGCDNADILNHLRGPVPHVRGCWCLDLLLGKD